MVTTTDLLGRSLPAGHEFRAHRGGTKSSPSDVPTPPFGRRSGSTQGSSGFPSEPRLQALSTHAQTKSQRPPLSGGAILEVLLLLTPHSRSTGDLSPAMVGAGSKGKVRMKYCERRRGVRRKAEAGERRGSKAHDSAQLKIVACSLTVRDLSSV